jgi:hypothetical protein
MKSTSLAVFLLLLSIPVSASAQGQSFGIGGRFSMVRGDVQAETSAERFTGGQIRARLSPRTALELSMDVRTETNEALTQRVRELPIQASLLLFPARTVFAPYVLGGGGWYSHRFETLADSKTVASETTRDFGWHGGFGAELKLGAHAGAHADYRYTFLRFGDDVPIPEAPRTSGESGVSRFLPSYKGSMWTAGLTLYF